MSRARAGSILAVFVLAFGLAGSAWSLDHFVVYEVKRVAANFGVSLTDQFAPAAKDAKTEALTRFSNPTRKVHGATAIGVSDINAHLSWYTINQPQVEPRRTVRFRNQFGQHSVDIKTPRFLLVPAQKTSHAGSAFPEKLDHYKCYEVIRINTAPTPPVVKLRDQFGQQPAAQVGKVRFFCNPVVKKRAGQRTKPIINKVDHLAVYAMPLLPKPVRIKVKDQFGERALEVVQRVLLTVPTEKQVAVAHPN